MARKTKPKAKQLSAREIAFRDGYLLHRNASKAARDAGYAHTTAESKAYQWVGKSKDSCPAHKHHLWDAIHEAMKAQSERTQIDADWLLLRLAEEVDADLADLYFPEGGLKPIHEWPPIWRKGLVAGVDAQKLMGDREEIGEIVKLKLSDRVKRLEMLGRHVAVQAFKDNVSVDVVDRAELLNKARARAGQ